MAAHTRRPCGYATRRLNARVSGNDMLAQARLWLLVGEAMSHQRKFGNAPYLVGPSGPGQSGQSGGPFPGGRGEEARPHWEWYGGRAASWVDRAERTATSGNPRARPVLSSSDTGGPGPW